VGNKLLALALSGLSLTLVACSDDEPSANPPATGGVSGNGGAAGGGLGGGGAGAGTGGSVAGSSGSAGQSGSDGGAGEPGFVEPMKLSETGLYSDIATDTIADDVVPFRPQFQLWSDDAVKRRFIHLPPGTQIDTSDMDYWVYPVGTKVWKEFTRDDVRVETRLLQKVEDDEWFMMAYRWNDAMSDADAVVDGEMNSRGTPHDIPSQRQCSQCHDNMTDRLLGVTALQLSHDIDPEGLDIADLIADSRLTAPPAAPFTMVGDQVQAAALGYMHANCGHCHNPQSVVTLDMQLWLPTAALGGDVTETPTYITTIDQDVTSSTSQPDWTKRVVPGSPDESGIYRRATFVPMMAGGQNLRMPPVGTELIDETGSDAIAAWIESL
jgi:hypothetical protein